MAKKQKAQERPQSTVKRVWLIEAEMQHSGKFGLCGAVHHFDCLYGSTTKKKAKEIASRLNHSYAHNEYRAVEYVPKSKGA